jgi:hypothetical protein
LTFCRFITVCSLTTRTPRTPQKPTAPATAIVQLYSQYEVDRLEQKHKDELRGVRDTYDKLLENMRHGHINELNRIKLDHANEMGNMRPTGCRVCRILENHVANTSKNDVDKRARFNSKTTCSSFVF